MSARRPGRMVLILIFVVLVGVGSVALATGRHGSGGEGLLPPLPAEEVVPGGKAPPAAAERAEGTGDHVVESAGRHGEEVEQAHYHDEQDLGAPPAPGAAALAGPPEPTVRRFAEAWANRNTVLMPATKREMIGLSAGAWASAVFLQARLTLPAIEGVGTAGGLEMMKLKTVAPGSKTALVVTRERLVDADGALSPPRYEVYLARVDRVSPDGYAITAWEPQR